MIPRLHSRDNKEITPDEKVVLASMIKMSKMLKLERGDHHFYPPQRLVVQNYKTASVSGTNLDFTVNVPIKFIQSLHPTKTMVQVEYANMDEVGHDPFHYTISLPDIPSAKDWFVNYNGTTSVYKTEPSSVIWSGLSTKSDATYYTFMPGINPVNTNQAGFPITDLNYLNNNYINIRVKSRDNVTLTTPIFDLTLVFYTYSGLED